MVRIREAGTEDWRAVQALLGQLGYNFTAEEMRARMNLLAASGTDPVLLAIQDGEAVGLIALHFATMLQLKEPAARITALVVRDRVRGAGVGTLLVDAGDNLARHSGCSILELTTSVARTEAHAFYGKLGFTNSSLRFSRSTKEIAAS
jgi:GNAT superfamily N-acetyltransferase